MPADGFLLGYHIPQMTGVPFSLALLDRLKCAFPDKFAGIKNSWTEAEFARAVGDHFDTEFVVMAGFDNLFQMTLEKHGSGCITASASLVSPLLRQVWEAVQAGEDPSPVQAELIRIRAVMDSCPPAPALLKALLARWHNLPLWAVRPPLLSIDPAAVDVTASALQGPF